MRRSPASEASANHDRLKSTHREEERQRREKCRGIYDTAKALLENSEEWEDRVKPSLELSKFFRSFVLPLAAISLYDGVHSRRFNIDSLDWFLSKPIFTLVASWPLSLAAAAVGLVLYVWLRARHMDSMYQLVYKSTYSRPAMRGSGPNGERRKAVPTRHLAIGETEPPGKQEKKRRPAFLLLPAEEFSLAASGAERAAPDLEK